MYKKIDGKYEYKFAIDKDGLYSITIEATCQKRNDLRVGIDEIKLRELPAEDKIQDYKIPPSWNGNELKGTPKTVVLILELLRGEHSLKFEAEGEAELLAEPKINFLERESLVAVLKNIQSPKKNRQPWVTAVLINLPLKYLDISATCRKNFLDSDDLQLIIDGEIQKHPGSLWWGKKWLWQGRLSKGITETRRIYKKLDRGIHYIELWADVAPTIESFQLSLGAESMPEELPKNIKQYTYKGLNGNQDYNRYDEIICDVVEFWNKEFLNDKYPVEDALDHSLVKAMIYQESKTGYFPGGETNIMQVGNHGDPSLLTLNGELTEYWMQNGEEKKLDYNGKANADTPRDSVYWGVRWLYHKAQGIKGGKRYWRNWKEAVKLYGPLGEEYKENVWSIYTKGVDKPSPKTSIKLWSLALLIPIFMSLSNFFPENIVRMNILNQKNPDYDEIKNAEVVFDREDNSLFFSVAEWEKDWWEQLKIGRLSNWKIEWLKMENLPDEQSILQAKFLRLEGFDNPIMEVYGRTHVGHGAFYLYKIENDKAELLLMSPAVDFNNDNRWLPENEEKYGYGTCGELYRDGKLVSHYEDINSDGITDVVLSGKKEVICEDQIEKEDGEWDFEYIKVAESEVRKVFLWDKGKGKFFEGFNNI